MRVVPELDARQTARAEAHDAVDVVEVGAGEERVADLGQVAPGFEVRVERRRAYEGAARVGALGKPPGEVDEGVARGRPVLRARAFEGQAAVEEVLRGARPHRTRRDREREEERVGLRGVVPALLHPGALGACRELGLRRHVGRGHDARLRLDDERRRDRRRRGRRAADAAGASREQHRRRAPAKACARCAHRPRPSPPHRQHPRKRVPAAHEDSRFRVSTAEFHVQLRPVHGRRGLTRSSRDVRSNLGGG